MPVRSARISGKRTAGSRVISLTNTIPVRNRTDKEFLEEVMVETSQALEMSEIYNGILNGMMDAYASIISNNMNVVMKVLAVATIVLSVPNIVFGAYGMNLAADGMPLANAPHAFFIIIILSVVLSLLVLWYFNHKKMY